MPYVLLYAFIFSFHRVDACRNLLYHMALAGLIYNWAEKSLSLSWVSGCWLLAKIGQDLWCAVLHWNSPGDPQISSSLMVCHWSNQLSQLFLIKCPEGYLKPSLGTSALSSLKNKSSHRCQWFELETQRSPCLWITSSEELIHGMSPGPLILACTLLLLMDHIICF